MKSSFIILFCVLCGLFVPCHAQSVPDSIQKDFYSLYFGHDKTTIDENYLENGKQLERLRSMLSTSVIDSIAIYAYSSPEGTQAHNMQLSLHRAEAVRDFILSNLPSNTTLDANDIHLFPAGENWKGLTKELETNYHLLNRDRVLKIMYADVPGDTKKWRLRNLDNGFTYSWIIQHHMPLLRVATLVGIYTSEPAEAKPDTIPALEPEPEPEPEPVLAPDTVVPAIEVEKKPRRLKWAVKTNLLYDAALMPNIGIEFYPRNSHWTIQADYAFSWWSSKKKHLYMQMLNGGLEARRYFKKDVHTGHYLSAYGHANLYDFGLDEERGWQGEGWGAGIGYGYVWRPWKNTRWRLEAFVHIGYYHSVYDPYHAGDAGSDKYYYDWDEPIENFIRRNHRLRWFGPTGAGFTISYDLF